MNEFDFSTFDEREERERQEQEVREATAQREAMEAQEETATAAPEPAAQTEEKAKDGPDLLGGMMEDLDMAAPGETSINDMGGRARFGCCWYHRHRNGPHV